MILYYKKVEGTMKSKFFKLVSIFMILFMVLTLTSCSKEDKIKETVLEEEEQEE